ncbi:MAG: hypothetical protein C5B58_13695 [Acidobacteria bacterium]|nr:MAG: hypothetical protein C5B58_13695 [Acidobacteriota bacterium]
MAQYKIEQMSTETWRLCISVETGGWKLLGEFGSEADATAAMSVFFERSKWAPPPPLFFDDESGTLMPIS